VRTIAHGAGTFREAFVNATTRELDGFAAYLAEFGLADGTVGIYLHQMKRAADEGGWIPRLKSELAPKTKRLVRAAARHWSSWKEDGKLRGAIDRLRLPAPRRQKAKVPLAREVLFQVMDVIEDPETEIDDALRATLGLMACRGFRDGDVLRMRRTEVMAALDQGLLAFEAKGRRRLEFAVIRTYRRWLKLLSAQPKWGRVDELIVITSKSPKARRAAAARKVQRTLAAIGEDLGITGLHPHQLRRTYCVEYLRAQKGDPEAVIKLTQHMQWANMATAMEYLDHLRGQDLDSVAETMFDRDKE
jgi:site-specific recombinase XerC